MQTPTLNIYNVTITVPERLWVNLANLRPSDSKRAEIFNTRVANLMLDNWKQMQQVWLAGEMHNQGELIFTGIISKLYAIKELREIFGEGLKEAKDICDVFLFPFYHYTAKILNEQI